MGGVGAGGLPGGSAELGGVQNSYRRGLGTSALYGGWKPPGGFAIVYSFYVRIARRSHLAPAASRARLRPARCPRRPSAAQQVITQAMRPRNAVRRWAATLHMPAAAQRSRRMSAKAFWRRVPLSTTGSRSAAPCGDCRLPTARQQSSAISGACCNHAPAVVPSRVATRGRRGQREYGYH